MKKKKIAFVITSLEVGGAEKMLLNLISNVDNMLYEIKVFIIKKNFQTIYDLELQNLGIDYMYLNKRTKIFFDFITTIKLARRLKQFNPDIIHSHLKSASYVILYKLANKKVKWIHTIHTIAEIDTKYLRKPTMGFLYRHHFVIPVAVSKSVRASAQKEYKLKEEDIQLVYNGIDIKKYTDINRIYNESLVITHIGRFEKVKNHRYIINEFHKLFKTDPMARLYLIGDGPLSNEIKASVKLKGLTTVVTFVGYSQDVSAYLKKTDIYILPSLYEGLSMSLIEAMAAGCALIASKVGGNQELVDNFENGFLIDNKPNQLYEKLVYLNNRRDLIEEMGQNNLKKVSTFSIDKMTKAYQDIYERYYEN